MKKFIREHLEPYLIIGGRNNESKEGKLVRGILNSWSNHTTVILEHNTRGFVIGDTHPPNSEIVDLEHYENIINNFDYEIRVWRILDATYSERKKMCMVWQSEVDGTPYSKMSMNRLWVMRIVNSLPYHIKGSWCSRAVALPINRVLPPFRSPMRKPGIKPPRLKKNETPRTFENRLVCGYLQDYTLMALQDV